MIRPSPSSISPWLSRPSGSTIRVLSRNPNARLSQLSAAMPSSYEIIGTIRGTTSFGSSPMSFPARRMAWDVLNSRAEGSEASEDFADSTHALRQRLARRRIRDPDVPLARFAECAAGCHGHGGVLEDARAQIGTPSGGAD